MLTVKCMVRTLSVPQAANKMTVLSPAFVNTTPFQVIGSSKSQTAESALAVMGPVHNVLNTNVLPYAVPALFVAYALT